MQQQWLLTPSVCGLWSSELGKRAGSRAGNVPLLPHITVTGLASSPWPTRTHVDATTSPIHQYTLALADRRIQVAGRREQEQGAGSFVAKLFPVAGFRSGSRARTRPGAHDRDSAVTIRLPTLWWLTLPSSPDVLAQMARSARSNRLPNLGELFSRLMRDFQMNIIWVSVPPMINR